MAAAAEHTAVQVEKVLPAGSLNPENVITPGIYVDTVVEVPTASGEAASREGRLKDDHRTI